MGLFFGTDGLRGKVNEDLTFDVAYKVGNALSVLKPNPTILIGCDSRISNSYLTCAVSSGAMSGGATVIDVGIIPTAGIAYLTRKINADYGIVISASHNSAEYNGIKIFNKDGYKLGDKEEEKIERLFIHNKTNNFPNIGKYRQDFSLVKKYRDYLVGVSQFSLANKTIVLDCAHGASIKIAPDVFRRLGARVFASNSSENGLKINKSCGALHPENLARKVKKYKADMGFAFDGDADRLIACTEKGDIIDGDMIIYALSKYLRAKGKLNDDTVVGTSHTNMGIERGLKEQGISLIRTDIGDKYVLAKMNEKNLSLGGEQSGHVILKEYATTGDGILSAIVLSNLLASENKSFSSVIDVKLYPQENVNVIVGDKFRIINNEEISKALQKFNSKLKSKGRVMIRASGTEPKIRIMVEGEHEQLNKKIAENIVELVNKIDQESW